MPLADKSFLANITNLDFCYKKINNKFKIFYFLSVVFNNYLTFFSDCQDK